MNLIKSMTVNANELIPFNQIITNWITSDSNYSIQYDANARYFIIEHASKNDYYITWKISLRTALTENKPIIALEYQYNDNVRNDYLIYPLKTDVIGSQSLYHITNSSTDDILKVGLKIIGTDNEIYVLSSDSQTHITASIIIVGL